MSVLILFIRHGETEWNRVQRIQGHWDTPLSADGFAQSEQLALRLAREAHEGSGIDALYSSDLSRAKQTAQTIAQALQCACELEPAFRERAYGQFEGLDMQQVQTTFPQDYAQWQSHDPFFEPPGGESHHAFFLRVTHALRTIIAEQDGRRVAIVAHGGVLDCAYRYAMDMPLDVPRDYPLLNASINTIEFSRYEAKIIRWGDVQHLTPGHIRDDGNVEPSRWGEMEGPNFI